VSESRAVRVGELLYKASHKLARSGSEFAKATFSVQQERGRVVWIKGRRRVVGRRSENAKSEGNSETNQTDEKNISHVPPPEFRRAMRARMRDTV
jgi:hypothetical protein